MRTPVHKTAGTNWMSSASHLIRATMDGAKRYSVQGRGVAAEIEEVYEVSRWQRPVSD